MAPDMRRQWPMAARSPGIDVGILLVDARGHGRQPPQAIYEQGASLGWIDDDVDAAVHLRVYRLGFIVGSPRASLELGAPLLGVGDGSELLAKTKLHGPFNVHARKLGRRPGDRKEADQRARSEHRLCAKAVG